MKKIDLTNKTIFITGAAGFIGSFLVKRILKEHKNVKIIGLDNLNNYYDVSIKLYRLKELATHKNFLLIKGDLANKELINEIF